MTNGGSTAPSWRRARLRVALLSLAVLGTGCAAADWRDRPLTDIERRRAELCDELIGVERMGCIQETAGRPNSPYDAAGRPVSTGR